MTLRVRAQLHLAVGRNQGMCEVIGRVLVFKDLDADGFGMLRFMIVPRREALDGRFLAMTQSISR